MTREDAITNLEMIRLAYIEPVTELQRKIIDDTFDIAIKALEQEPTALFEQVRWERDVAISQLHELGYEFGEKIEQKLCEDAISRQAVLNILDDMVREYIKENDFDKAQGVAWVKVQKLSSVSTEKTGRWIFDERIDKHYYCSECKAMGADYFDYCPYCGARMEVEE